MKHTRICVFLASLFVLTSGCGRKKVKQVKSVPKHISLYEIEKHEPSDWDAETLWEQKLKILSETNIPNINSIKELSKNYILDLAKYQQNMSPEGLLYDSKNKKYILNEADAQYFAEDLLGVRNFRYRETPEYNREEKTYEFTDLPNLDVVSREYKNQKLKKLQNSKWKFSVDVFEINIESGKASENYTTEVYTIKDNASGYKLVSVKRFDPNGQELANSEITQETTSKEENFNNEK